ncbi:YfhD family protein [Paenibacillus agricola]|uniref:YfhD family protein n=1 Tax=Paenibacillus agricola TaxID=2716264 RepID=A0ABX0JK87_9BACL|nr:YfhD family protein [Paenibacillus agricola]NHN34421.1 YfhD family protein [Paenibacillus agricola]
MKKQKVGDGGNKEQLPVIINEDVEYSAELADNEDVEAASRSDEADKRQKRTIQS